MIRVRKSDIAPQSLLDTGRYDGEDVQQTLLADQHKKCYLCERAIPADYEIDHLKSQKGHPELRQAWANLFLSCKYCNGRKKEADVVNPTERNIEEELEHRVDFLKNSVSFKTSSALQVYYKTTIDLLTKLFNGKGGLRKTREEEFFELFRSKLYRFQVEVNEYLSNPSDQNRQCLKESLDISSEYLGFKYWIIKNNPVLLREFKDDIVWNKV